MNYKQYLTEKFIAFVNFLDFGTFEVFVNATKDEIDHILQEEKELNETIGIRIGVMNPDEIYYWKVDVEHSAVQYKLKLQNVIKSNFNLKITYEDNEIYSSSYYPPDNRKELFAEIKDKLLILFPGARIGKELL